MTTFLMPPDQFSTERMPEQPSSGPMPEQTRGTLSFTNYLRCLPPDGEGPTWEQYESLLASLRRALVRMMQKKGIWEAPPSYLGIYGGSRWEDGDALEDLTLDCYSYVFVDRLHALRNQLTARGAAGDIAGYVFLNIRNFLYETQKRHDPLGARIFKVVHQAICLRLEEGTLHVLSGDIKVRNNTILGFASCVDVDQLTNGEPGRDAINERVPFWNDELLPDLVIGRSSAKISARLGALLDELHRNGVEAFSFGDLMSSIRENVRVRWNGARYQDAGLEWSNAEDFEEIVQLVRPDEGYVERQSFEKLLHCTGGQIDRKEGREKTRDYLERLWLFIRDWVAEPENGTTDGADPQIDSGNLPANRRLSRTLDIPRARLNELRETLGTMVEFCRENIHKGPSDDLVNLAGSAASLTERRASLCMATAEAASRWSSPEMVEKGQSLAAGDLFLCEETWTWPVEWMVVDVLENELCRVIPLDNFSLVGGKDIEWNEKALVLRSGKTGLVDSEKLKKRTGHVPEILVASARKKAGDGDSQALSWSQREVENDPQYQAWCATLDEAVNALGTVPEAVAEPMPETTPVDEPPPRARVAGKRWRSARRALATKVLAAVFAFMSVGLLWQVVQLQDQVHVGDRQVADLKQPMLVPISEEIVFGSVRRGQSLEVARDKSFGLYVVLQNVAEFELYRLRLLNAQGDQVWSTEVPPLELVDQALVVPRGVLETGSYQLELAGLAGDDVQVLETKEVGFVVR